MTTERTNAGLFDVAPLITVLICAVAIRLLYQDGMIWFGGSFNNGSDSGTYIAAARQLASTGVLHSSDRLPLYIYFVAGVFKIVGSDSLRAVVTVQAFLDALSVLGLALAAKALSPRLILPTAIIAAIIPNFLVQASYILQENLFILFFSWGLCALLWALRRERPATLLAIAGALFGVTLWIRLTLSYFPLFLVPATAVALRLQLPFSWKRSVGLSFIPALVMLMIAFPLLTYNYLIHGHIALSSQPGSHLLNWVYGCLATPWPCSNRKSVVAELHPLIADYIKSFGSERPNAYDISAFEKTIAIERILRLPLWQIVWGITWGAIRNVFQTAFYAVLSQFNQPPNFLSAMPGTNTFERISAFVSLNKNNVFMMLWAISQIALIFSRIIQTIGAVIGLKRKEFRGATILLLATIAYILVLNGPIADPKYRIPCEPSFIILFALGLMCGPVRLRIQTAPRDYGPLRRV
jgi:hypothetical protein